MNFQPSPIELPSLEDERKREYEDQDEAEDHLLRGEQEKEDPEEEEDDDDDGSDVGSEDSLTSEEEAEMTRLMLEEHIDVVMSIIKPVSLTMILVIILVLCINAGPDQQKTTFIWMPYHEPSTDTTTKKIEGGILNAFLFIVMVVCVTFVLVGLFYFRCMKIIYGWLILSTSMLIMSFGGGLIYEICQATNQPMDIFSFGLILWNFAVGGVVVMFYYGPARFQQGYAIAISVLLALVFTKIPEYTTWAVLLALALYDLAAVLCPQGPLRLLVNLAQQRGESIPALLYNGSVLITMAQGNEDNNEEGEELQPMDPARVGQLEMSDVPTPDLDLFEAPEGRIATNDEGEGEDVEEVEEEDIVLPEEENAKERRSVKLGLGDFVFYSVLMGRAALYDITTIFTCFLAIIAGLFLTLVLLGVFKQALPALPISIALGVAFFFMTKAFVIPLVIEFGVNSVFC